MILTSLPTADIVCDVCIVGSGPVGIAVALECERNGLKVLLLEAGSEKPSRSGWTERFRQGSTPGHASTRLTTRSAFGGTSWAWSGVCAAFDDTDFDQRSHVAHSGWPISHSAISPYYADAARILHCDKSSFRPSSEGRMGEGIEDVSFAISKKPQLSCVHREHFERSQSIIVAMNSRVSSLLVCEESRRVEGLRVISGGREVILMPSRIVLAAGGLKSTQLLLEARRHSPQLFGGLDGPLGRYYMGHLGGSIASVSLSSADARTRDFHNLASRRFKISKAKLASERLLNVAFWTGRPLLCDPSHADPLLSAAFLAHSIPRLGDFLRKGAAPAHLAPSLHLRKHVKNVVASPADAILGAGRLLWNKMKSRPSLNGRVQTAQVNTFALVYHAESEPNRESRVVLTDKRDAFGMPEMRVNLIFGEGDAASIARAHGVFESAFREAGIGSLSYVDAPNERVANILSQARDGYHQIGTTRMGTAPATSVVDQDCRVHGVRNLYVASSSVFPTSGQANPTLLATALGIRLARHLAASVKQASTVILFDCERRRDVRVRQAPKLANARD